LIELRYEQVSLCRLVVLVGIDTVLAQCKVLYKNAIGAAQVRIFFLSFRLQPRRCLIRCEVSTFPVTK
jgi:hypothetical protein